MIRNLGAMTTFSEALVRKIEDSSDYDSLRELLNPEFDNLRRALTYVEPTVILDSFYEIDPDGWRTSRPAEEKEPINA